MAKDLLTTYDKPDKTLLLQCKDGQWVVSAIHFADTVQTKILLNRDVMQIQNRLRIFQRVAHTELHREQRRAMTVAQQVKEKQDSAVNKTV